MRRITKAALGGLAGCALIIGATQAANASVDYFYRSGNGVDLQPATTSPFDSAEMTLRIKEATDASNFKLTVEGIDASTANPVHGAHLHVGACAGDPAALNPGPHFQHVIGGGVTPLNEVWFDLVTNDHGVATDSTTVPFVPVDNDGTPGAMSIVIHQEPAAVPGALSPKLACFDLAVTEDPEWTTTLF